MVDEQNDVAFQLLELSFYPGQLLICNNVFGGIHKHKWLAFPGAGEIQAIGFQIMVTPKSLGHEEGIVVVARNDFVGNIQLIYPGFDPVVDVQITLTIAKISG